MSGGRFGTEVIKGQGFDPSNQSYSEYLMEKDGPLDPSAGTYQEYFNEMGGGPGTLSEEEWTIQNLQNR